MEELVECPLGASEGVNFRLMVSDPHSFLSSPQHLGREELYLPVTVASRIMLPEDALTPGTSEYVMLTGQGNSACKWT